MKTTRLEAFSDGVLAIIITIMVLDLKVPHGGTVSLLDPLKAIFLSYALSFFYVGVYWTNHHHMLQTCKRITGAILWSNLHLLFWLSLVPFVTAWMGENHFMAIPTVFYAGVLLMAAISYMILQRVIIASQGRDSLLKKAVGRDLKGKGSFLLYVTAVITAFWQPLIANGMLLFAALFWVLPDRRIEHEITKSESLEEHGS